MRVSAARRQTLRRAIVTAALVCAGLAAAAEGAGAQELGGGAHDSDQPIEISADSLEVQQDAQIAIFSGSVMATQGEMVLHADSLRVHYRERGGGTEAESTERSISRIDAVGNVFLSSPAETAQGAAGVYDVDAGMITLDGGVVLTRGENVIRGDRLVLNLATGRSRVESSSESGSGRVRALFVPPKKGDGD